MSEMLKDIEEDMRRERMARFMNVFGKLAVAVSVVVVLGTIAAVVWKNHERERAMAETGRFTAASEQLNAGNYKDAAAAFGELAGDSTFSYSALASLREAQALALAGNKAEAVKTYQALAQQHGVFAELAQIAAAQGAGAVAQATPGSAFYASASEWNAWQLLQQGKKDEAVKAFAQLRDSADVSNSMRARITQALATLAPGTIQKPTAAQPQDETHE